MNSMKLNRVIRFLLMAVMLLTVVRCTHNNSVTYDDTDSLECVVETNSDSSFYDLKNDSMSNKDSKKNENLRSATKIQEISFVNQVLDVYHFESFFQDSKGRIWGIAEPEGLMMWNGMNFEETLPIFKGRGLRTHFELDSVTYLLGGDDGLYKFHIPTKKVSKIGMGIDQNVVSIDRLDDNVILILTKYGLVSYDKKEQKSSILHKWGRFSAISFNRLDIDRYLILTKEVGFLIYDVRRNELSNFQIHGEMPDRELLTCFFVYNLKLLIGSDTGLYICDLNTGIAKKEYALDGIYINAISYVSNHFFIGTNDGLYVGNQDGEYIAFRHSPNYPNTILNNRIWNSFDDKYGNVWIATDRGVSVMKRFVGLLGINWKEPYNHDNSNRVTAILHDNRDRLWVGSFMGLSCENLLTGETIHFSKNNLHRIPDNLINNIQQDSEGRIWIFTENGMARFDESSKCFISPTLIDPSNGTRVNNVYNFSEGNRNQIFISTWENSLLEFNKQKIIDTKDGSVVADRIFSTRSLSNPMEFDGVTFVKCANDTIWCASDRLYYWATSEFKADSLSTKILPYPWVKKLFLDKSNRMWFINENRIFMRHGESDSIYDISSTINRYGKIKESCIGDDKIWLLCKSGLCVFDVNKKTIRHLFDFNEGLFTAVGYGSQQNCLWLGGLYGHMKFDAGLLLNTSSSYMPSIASILINDKAIDFPLNSEGFIDALYCDDLTLSPTQSKIRIRFDYPSMPDIMEISNNAFYRLIGISDEWLPIDPYSPYVDYHIIPGKYNLQLGLERNGKIEIIEDYRIIAKGPWYESWWFNILIILTALILISILFVYYRVKQRLKISEIERQHSLSMSQKKTEFMTELSRELKNPLTLLGNVLARIEEVTRNHHIKEELSKSKEYTKEMDEIINRIMDVHGKESFEQENACLNDSSSHTLQLINETGGVARQETYNIVLIEDNSQLADYIMQNTTAINWMRIPNDEDVIDQIIHIQPSLIVCEFKTANIDGLKLLKKLKLNVLTRKIPVFFLSSHSDVQYQVNAYKAGAERFIQKPFDIQLLSSSLLSFLRNMGIRHQADEKKEDSKSALSVPVPKTDNNDKFISDLNQVIDRNIDDPSLNVAKIAKELGISEKSLYRKLKDTFASSGVEYIRQRRLDRAAELLRIPQYNINEVMYLVGFSSPSYFSKCFSNKFGMTPSEFRDKSN